jgi:hypothetical protein
VPEFKIAFGTLALCPKPLRLKFFRQENQRECQISPYQGLHSFNNCEFEAQLSKRTPNPLRAPSCWFLVASESGLPARCRRR